LIFLACQASRVLARAGFTVTPPPAQGLQPLSLLPLCLVGWRLAGLFSFWMVALVKTPRASVSKLLSTLLSPFPSHSPPFSSRVAYLELCFAKMGSPVQGLRIFVLFWQLKHGGVRFTTCCIEDVEFTAAGAA